MSRSTSYEKQQRVEAVVAWLSEGKTRREIVELCSRDWEVKARQADNYIGHAVSLLRSAGRSDLLRHRGEARARLLRVWNEAMEKKNFTAALRAEAMLAKLMGTDDFARAEKKMEMKPLLVSRYVDMEHYKEDIAAEQQHRSELAAILEHAEAEYEKDRKGRIDREYRRTGRERKPYENIYESQWGKAKGLRIIKGGRPAFERAVMEEFGLI